MTNQIGYVATDTTLAVVFNGEMYTFHESYPDFADIRDACVLDDSDSLSVFIRKFTEQLFFLDGRVFSKAGVMYLVGGDGVTKSVDHRLHTRISQLASTDGDHEDLNAIINMTDKLYKNPDVNAIEDLFRFLDHNTLPITQEGNFLAYKVVRGDYKDIFSGTFDNSVGTEPSMPREMCEKDRSVTCSRGLHFCSKEYLPHYGNMNSRIMVVEVSPTDVVSIPTDYNNAKGRACKYKIIGEIPNDQFREEAIAIVESSVVAKLGNLLTRIKSFFSKSGE